MTRLAAIVLNYRTPDDTFLAVRSLLLSRRRVDEVIVVDNDAGGGCEDALRSVRDAITYLPAAVNLGFSGGMNLGLRAALARGADRLLLVNSDAIVPPDCIVALERALDTPLANPAATVRSPTAGVGIVGPAILSRSAPDTIASLGIRFYPATGRMRQRGHGRPFAPAPAGPGEAVDAEAVDAVSGCVMLIRREVLDVVGLLDEAYFFTFEDVDFCLRAREAGFATVLARDAVVYHEGSRSIGAGSPRRLYFAARNHLRLAERAAPAGRLATCCRRGFIVGLNLAHAVRATGGSVPLRIAAVVRGTRDHLARRYGAGP